MQSGMRWKGLSRTKACKDRRLPAKQPHVQENQSLGEATEPPETEQKRGARRWPRARDQRQGLDPKPTPRPAATTQGTCSAFAGLRGPAQAQASQLGLPQQSLLPARLRRRNQGRPLESQRGQGPPGNRAPAARRPEACSASRHHSPTRKPSLRHWQSGEPQRAAKAMKSSSPSSFLAHKKPPELQGSMSVDNR